MSWGVAGLLSRELLDRGWPALGFAGIRSAVAFGLLAALVGLLARHAFRLRRRDLGPLAAYSAIASAALPYTLLATMERAPIAVAIALFYTAPPLAALLGRLFLGESISRLALLSLGTTCAGVALVSGLVAPGEGLAVSAAGLGFGLAAGLCSAVFAVGGRHLVRTMSATTITLYSSGLGALGLLVVDAARTRSVADVPRLGWDSVLLLLATAFLPVVLARFLFTWSMNTIGSAQATMLSTLELATAAVGGMVAFGETPGGLEAAGIAVIFLAAILVRLDLRGQPAPPS
ncbi:MAG: DMT family transporter [Thermoleophilia bacterium]|nr:DMT family transporter [Thermoleophilia bacterium]